MLSITICRGLIGYTMIFDKTNMCLNKSKYEDIYVVYSFALAVVIDSKKKGGDSKYN